MEKNNKNKLKTPDMQDIYETMHEVFENAENSLILTVNAELFKYLSEDKATWKTTQLSSKRIHQVQQVLQKQGQELLKSVNHATNNAIQLAGVKSIKTDILSTNSKAMGMLIGSALNYYTKSVRQTYQLAGANKLYKQLLEQSKKGFDNGLTVTHSNGRRYEYKSYMEMRVRTTVSNEIHDQMMDINETTQNVFFICNFFGDCAKDHKDLQGKIYFDERYITFDIPKETLAQIKDIIREKKMLSIQEVTTKPYWLTTRPNCRHRFVPITVSQVLNNSNVMLLEKLKLKKGTYKNAKYVATQKLRYIERRIRYFKDLKQNYNTINGLAPDADTAKEIKHYASKVSEWQKKARIFIDETNKKLGANTLVRDYERETRRVIVQDLGVKYHLSE